MRALSDIYNAARSDPSRNSDHPTGRVRANKFFPKFTARSSQRRTKNKNFARTHHAETIQLQSARTIFSCEADEATCSRFSNLEVGHPVTRRGRGDGFPRGMTTGFGQIPQRCDARMENDTREASATPASSSTNPTIHPYKSYYSSARVFKRMRTWSWVGFARSRVLC